MKKAREGVMEFLLINHPLDCPICPIQPHHQPRAAEAQTATDGRARQALAAGSPGGSGLGASGPRRGGTAARA